MSRRSKEIRNLLGNTSGNSLGNTSGNSLGNTSGNSLGNTSGNSEAKCISSRQSQVSNKVTKEIKRKRYYIIVDFGVHKCM